MKVVNWSKEKEELLRQNRGIDLRLVATMIENSDYIDIVEVPSRTSQYMFILNYNNYIVCVPFIENNVEIFLKTAYKSRKLNKFFRG